MSQRRRSHNQSNILVFVLDQQGKLVHSFDGMTDNHPADMFEIKKRMPGYFVQELKKAARSMNLTQAATSRSKESHLPAATDPALRVFVSLGENRLSHFQVPTVEALSIDESEKQALRYSATPQKLEAQTLKRWFAQMYPPAVMDGHGGMDNVSGTLSYQSAGENDTHRFATLRGTVRFELDNKTRITYQGPCDIVLRYSKTSDELESVSGLVTTRIPRVDPRGKTVETVSMAAVLESIPPAKRKSD